MAIESENHELQSNRHTVVSLQEEYDDEDKKNTAIPNMK
jgi:hypothetical protein